jgi:hypothetical protein
MDNRVDVALRELSAIVEFPPTPELRAAVAARLSDSTRRGRWPWALPRAVALAVAATLVLAAAAAALVLVLPGLRIAIVPSLPSAGVPVQPLAVRLALGTPVAVDAIGAGVPAVLGAPDEAYVLGDHEVLSLVYAADPDLPELGGSGIGLLVQVIDGDLDRERVLKLVGEVGASVTEVRVGSAPGFWVSGPPHLVHYTSPSGIDRSQATRVAGDTLVWERDSVLYRIESGLGLTETLRIAESIGR